MVFGGKTKQTGLIIDRGFEMSERKSLIRLQDLFILEKKRSFTKTNENQVHARLLKTFFRIKKLDQQIVGAISLNAFTRTPQEMRANVNFLRRYRTRRLLQNTEKEPTSFNKSDDS